MIPIVPSRPVKTEKEKQKEKPTVDEQSSDAGSSGTDMDLEDPYS